LSANEKIQQSKLCLADYTGSSYDTLKLSLKCRELFSCIQLKDAGIWSWVTLFFDYYFKEIVDGYHFSAVALGFLFIVLLIEAITTLPNPIN
jgi:hypothetical protein